MVSDRRDKHSRQSKASSRERTWCASDGKDSMGEAKLARSRQATSRSKRKWGDGQITADTDENFGLYSK